MWLLIHALASAVEIRTWKSNYFPSFYVDTITYTHTNPAVDLANLCFQKNPLVVR